MFTIVGQLGNVKFVNFLGSGYDINIGIGMRGYSSVEQIDFGGKRVLSRTSLFMGFDGCNNLKSIDVSNIDVSNATLFRNCFNSCNNLTTIDLSNWQINNNLEEFSYVFYSCRNLQTIIFPATSLDFNGAKANLASCFYGCYKLQSIGNLTDININTLQDGSSLFCYCSNLTNLPNIRINNVSGTDYTWNPRRPH